MQYTLSLLTFVVQILFKNIPQSSTHPNENDVRLQMTLNNIHVGQTATVLAISPTETGFRRKLLSLGMTPGAQIKVKRLAPLGDPMEIEVRGFSLSLRKSEAQTIQVEIK